MSAARWVMEAKGGHGDSGKGKIGGRSSVHGVITKGKGSVERIHL